MVWWTMVAALAMLGSSVGVVLNARRLRTSPASAAAVGGAPAVASALPDAA